MSRLVLVLALATAGAAPPRPTIKCSIEAQPDGTTIIRCPRKPVVIYLGL